MAVWRESERAPQLPGPTALTIGAYDGVHRGHRAVIAGLQRRAAELGLPTAVVIFDRHPATIVAPEAAPLQLTDTDQEVELLESTGVDHVVVLTFDEARAKEDPTDFVRHTLVEALRAALVLVGSDFRFGHRRAGDVELLRRLGPGLGFEVVGLDLVSVDGAAVDDDHDKVSSTAVRRLLSAGDVAAANALLGRQHEVRGPGAAGGGGVLSVTVAPDVQLPAAGAYTAWAVGGDAAPLAVQAVVDAGRVDVTALDGPPPPPGPCRVRFVERTEPGAAPGALHEL